MRANREIPKFKGRFFRRGTAAGAILGGLAVTACLFATQEKPPVILFMGNSITWNVPVPEVGWHGDWGMAASRQERDYAHQTTRILQEKGLELELRIAGRNCPECFGALDEQIRNMGEVRRLRPRYVVVQLSEHSFEIELRSGKMARQYRQLVQALVEAGVSPGNIYCLGSWGETDVYGLHAENIKEGIRDFPEVNYVDISAVSADPANYGDSSRFQNPGVRWHPGDGGMLGMAGALAGAIWEDR